MDLQLTHRGDYAVRAAIALAKASTSGTLRKLREIAEEMDIPQRYTHEIVTLLVRNGIATATSGKQGGYRLALPPEEITLLSVIEAAEGQLKLNRCTLSGGPCYWQGFACAVHPYWEEASRQFISSLETHTLADIVDEDQKIAQGVRRGRKPQTSLQEP